MILSNIMQIRVLIVQILNKAADLSDSDSKLKMSILYFRHNIVSHFVWFSSAKSNIQYLNKHIVEKLQQTRT